MLDKYLQPKPALLFVLVMASIQYLMYCKLLFWPSDTFTYAGDFVVFWPAAKAILDGNMVSLYIGDGMHDAMLHYRPEGALERLTWQYPPHAGLIFSPIGLLPFPVAYLTWFALGVAALAGSLTVAKVDYRAIVVLMLTSPVFLALITGQIALFMTSLMLLAVFWAKSRPILAGLAAGLLTLKPQLGIFLPLVFIAGGHWRAFASAAVISLTLWLGSAALLGIDVWVAFFERLGLVSDLVSEGVMPYSKMLNVYAASNLALLPEVVASGITVLAALAAACAVFWTSRKTDDPRWRYAVLATVTLLVTPYSWYYELALVLPAVWFVLERGYRNRWLEYERESAAFLFALSVSLPGSEISAGVSVPFLVMIAVGIIVGRRVMSELTGSASRSSANSHPSAASLQEA
ncbi:MAG: hypothetical protein Hens2KO_07390 [Henriciella sp.]